MQHSYASDDFRVQEGIRFDTLAKICQALECLPGDILAWEAD
ncbi:helix-turn-helix domain-containing protein [Klebsiella michiganensis]|uniref:Helix-turn-helix domain-containing protein n=1 Tax=Klebsiella michiganensis TaxID=1134687 RepID=A0AAJ1KSQ8_9ENTR|nr:helix-turn-helix domain-containing protein [Klebsiella michiganensis]ARB20309.1 Cro/Cl family transcriptional regulator [Klebsiella oxytoca]MCZ0062301.1 helix-turn-helix domain-containing protein [Klebsiella michiganensis]MCZ0078306.1 helix-turn-helix domain-containing protein [Klebsiella michiganensis]MDH0964249.1 helix-turn-helix domain-containing protein [Klebsiella michiganensis]MDI3169344.1 helix-turn-helix domain-containing protein [Klebsiella michiganensis]